MTGVLSDFNETILIIMLLTSSIITLLLGGYVYVKSQLRPVIVWFLLCFFLVLVWNLFYLFWLYAPTVTISWVIMVVEIIAVILIGPISYLFQRAYRGLSSKLTIFGYMAFVMAIGLILAVISNPMHLLLFTQYTKDSMTYGPLRYVILAYVLMMISVGVYHFAKSLSQPTVYKKQQVWYLGGAVYVPIIAYFIQLMKISPEGIQLVQMVFPFSLILITIAIMKYQFLDILPYSLTEVVESIDDGFVVISLNGNLEDYNRVFFNRFLRIDKCRTIEELLILLRNVVDNRVALNNIRYSINVKNDNYVSGELVFRTREGTTNIQYTTKAINDIYGVKIATIITFHDITEIQHLYQTVEAKKQELMLARERLEEHIETVQLLTVETERNKLMAEVHDTLGHTMAEVLALLEKCDIALNEAHFEKEKAESIIDEASNRARESLTEIRAAVTRFKKMGVE